VKNNRSKDLEFPDVFFLQLCEEFMCLLCASFKFCFLANDFLASEQERRLVFQDCEFHSTPSLRRKQRRLKLLQNILKLKM